MLPADVVLSALKPRAEGEGIVLRLLNPGDREQRAQVRLGFPCTRLLPTRLDETPCGPEIDVAGGAFELVVPPHALRTVVLRA